MKHRTSKAKKDPHPLLKLTVPNMEGEDVLRLQNLLGKNRMIIQADGVFGIRTHKAVFHFQNSRGMIGRGVCDEETWKALEEG